MPTFYYEAVDSKGKEVNGTLNSESKITAINKIREMGYFPSSVTEKKADTAVKKTTAKDKPTAIKIPFFEPKVKEKDLVTFMRQFATLVDAGLPILRGLRVLEKQNQKKSLYPVIKEIGDNIESGNSLSNSLKNQSNVFSPLFINMVNAGEVGGVLDRVLLQMADYFEKNIRLKKKIKSAMVYPCIVLLVAFVVVYALVGFIIPKFAVMFEEMNLKLPFLTQILISLSKIFKEYWYMPFIILPFIGLVFKLILSNQKGRFILHAIVYRLPIVGDLISKVATARFTLTLGTLIDSGVQILEAVLITRSTVGNAVVERALDLVHDNIKEGESMVNPLTQSNIFQPMVLSMVAVGEETGRISEMLLKIAQNYEEDVDNTVQALTALLEPVLIVTLALIVGFIVIAMFLPLIELISSMTN